jgi:hypothetical protein
MLLLPSCCLIANAGTGAVCTCACDNTRSLGVIEQCICAAAPCGEHLTYCLARAGCLACVVVCSCIAKSCDALVLLDCCWSVSNPPC